MTTNRPEKLDEALIRPGRVDHQVAFGNATQTQIRELFERMYTNDLPRTTFVKSASSTMANGSAVSSKLAAIKEKDEILTPPITPMTASYEHTNGHAVNGNAKSPNGAAVTNGAVVIGEKDNGEVSEEELKKIARTFSEQVPDDMFSPAEIQGFLLKRKKDPRKAAAEVEHWVQGMVEVKRKGTKLVNVQ
jgi:mitochondrial chaperone BCS1